ncbi:MAG: EAL domain-containing protein, partial [Actinomycetota bacterium]
PELGVIRPDEFIAAAEQNGMVTDLTRHVLHASLQWQRLWAAAGIDLQVAVNISARSLVDDRLADMVSSALARHRVPANRLTLERTESSVVSDPSITIATLRRLRTLGVRLAVDDFGTGYSSLAYLRELPVDEVKIDKSFVIPLVDELHTPPLLSGIINLCREMGFELVGEGIENATVQRKLTDMGCSRGQGFHIARPMDGADLLEWQARWHDDRHLSIVL